MLVTKLQRVLWRPSSWHNLGRGSSGQSLPLTLGGFLFLLPSGLLSIPPASTDYMGGPWTLFLKELQQNAHNIKFAISDCWYFHNVIQPPLLSSSRTSSSFPKETPYPVSRHSCPSSWPPGKIWSAFSVSVDLPILKISYKGSPMIYGACAWLLSLSRSDLKWKRKDLVWSTVGLVYISAFLYISSRQTVRKNFPLFYFQQLLLPIDSLRYNRTGCFSGTFLPCTG